MELTPLQKKITRGFLSRIGFALCAMLALNIGLTYLIAAIREALPALPGDPWLFALLANYTLSPLVCALILRPVPKAALGKECVRPGKMFTIFLMCYGIAILANLLGNLIATLLGQETPFSLLGDTAIQTILETPTTFFSIFTICFFGPVIEELVFRKLLIDRLARYGEWVAVFMSALLFGLFHGNFLQFFYAFGLGLAFGHLYYKTGRIWYTILLHCVINTIPNLLLPILREGRLMPLMIVGMLVLLVVASGVTLTIIWVVRFFRRRRAMGMPALSPRVCILPQKGWAGLVFLNPGMLTVLAACVVYFCMELLVW
ncbi:MAG TPA: hypothetical protein DEB31_04575 [Clostridiales bacterium]|nr:hypothetical protein [Clostridiales bacterium]